MSIGKIIRPILTFSNVAQANTSTAQITPGRTIESIILVVSGNVQAATAWDITNATHTPLIRIKANGKTIIEGTGAQLAALSYFRGHGASSTYLPISFIESKKGRDFLDEMVGAFDTSAGVANITVEVQIGGAGGAFTGTLKAYTIESAPQAANPHSKSYAGLMHKVLRYPWALGVGGALNVPLPFGPVNGAILKRLHIGQTNGLVTAVTLKQDGVVLSDTLLADNQYVNTLFSNTNQANFYTLDFMADGNLKNALDTRDARSLELQVTCSNADNGFVIAEYLDQLGNL